MYILQVYCFFWNPVTKNSFILGVYQVFFFFLVLVSLRTEMELAAERLLCQLTLFMLCSLFCLNLVMKVLVWLCPSYAEFKGTLFIWASNLREKKVILHFSKYSTVDFDVTCVLVDWYQFWRSLLPLSSRYTVDKRRSSLLNMST